MPDPDRILRIRTVLDRTGLSRSTLYRKIAEGSFPRQLKLGEHSAGWRESAISRWIANPADYSESPPDRRTAAGQQAGSRPTPR